MLDGDERHNVLDGPVATVFACVIELPNDSSFDPGFSNIMLLFPEEGFVVIVTGKEWACGVAFRDISIRDTIGEMACSLNLASELLRRDP